MRQTALPAGLWKQDPESLASELFGWSERLVGTEGAVIHLLTSDGLQVRWLTEAPSRVDDTIPLDLPEPGPIARAALEGVTQIVIDRSQLAGASIGKFNWKAALCIPLLVEDEVVGVFSAGWRMPINLSEDMRLVLEAAASLTASALHRTGLLEDVKRERHRLREAMESLPMLASIVDHDTLTVRWTNQQTRRVLGNITGQSILAALTQDSIQLLGSGSPSTQDGIRAVLRGEMPVRRIRARRSRGDWCVLETTIAPLDDGTSLILQMDVTRDAHMEEERDRFVHMLSHHLRTPLTPILGFIDLIDTPGINPAIKSEAVATIKTSVRRIEDVVAQLEEIASLRPVDPAAMTIQPAASLIDQAAGEIPGLTEEMLQVSGVDQVLVQCASQHVVKALRELFSNAILHGAPPISVSVEAGRYVEMLIRDSGDGIPPEWERAVFLPFLNAVEGYLAPAPDSLGLGLTLSRALIVATGGDLTYADQAFSVRLRAPTSPLHDHLDTPHQAVASTSPTQPPNSRTDTAPTRPRRQ